MKLTADEYRLAALERISDARTLHDAARYGAAIYLAGAAVECMLRAYRVRVEPEFDSRHDMKELLKASGLRHYVPEKRRAEVAVALGEVWSRWKNDYRYVSNDRLLRDLRDKKLTLGIKGDQNAQLKESSRRVLERAQYLVGLGVARWNQTA